jgi:hypothetical protein
MIRVFKKPQLKVCPGGGMVDTLVLEASAERREGSSPFPGTRASQKRPGGRF